MSIKAAIFYVESAARLLGKENLLLRISDEARVEHQALLDALRACLLAMDPKHPRSADAYLKLIMVLGPEGGVTATENP
jgi:16S rRNA U1498 N3-methylase RsmE